MKQPSKRVVKGWAITLDGEIGESANEFCIYPEHGKASADADLFSEDEKVIPVEIHYEVPDGD